MARKQSKREKEKEEEQITEKLSNWKSNRMNRRKKYGTEHEKIYQSILYYTRHSIHSIVFDRQNIH